MTLRPKPYAWGVEAEYDKNPQAPWSRRRGALDRKGAGGMHEAGDSAAAGRKGAGSRTMTSPGATIAHG
jgi:hypothetical protein